MLHRQRVLAVVPPPLSVGGEKIGRLNYSVSWNLWVAIVVVLDGKRWDFWDRERASLEAHATLKLLLLFHLLISLFFFPQLVPTFSSNHIVFFFSSFFSLFFPLRLLRRSEAVESSMYVSLDGNRSGWCGWKTQTLTSTSLKETYRIFIEKERVQCNTT